MWTFARGEGSGSCGQREGGQNLNLIIFVDVINGWPLMDDSMFCILGHTKQVDLLCAGLLESHYDRFQVSQK